MKIDKSVLDILFKGYLSVSEYKQAKKYLDSCHGKYVQIVPDFIPDEDGKLMKKLIADRVKAAERGKK